MSGTGGGVSGTPGRGAGPGRPAGAERGPGGGGVRAGLLGGRLRGCLGRFARLPGPRARGERGAATVWAVAVVVVLGVVWAGVLAMGQAVVARHRAGGAADLAALAAAGVWIRGETAACGKAAEVAAAQDARLVRCSVRGEVSDVTAEAGTGPFSVAVRARAGPAGPGVEGTTPRGSQRPQGASVHPKGGPVRQERPGPAGLP
ncbi:hypothetical protein GCM10010346_37100 [Streptomyces chryseus]|uniref:Putative Flp pilus-assembly TadG-like N-terminal domain-containing protein n=1 Tax=Streptomyces chryseus TaxID=68186 RepID=A0ABQ3DQE8_9ACTN|nr:hypothetical protein GCM10010346_37100 [Streptomyces chryseus]